MGTTTPIRGLYKPAKNETNYDALVNANFDNLDVVADKSYVDTQLALKAPLASPSLSGNPTAPTPAAGDSSVSIATTAFIKNALSVPWLTVPYSFFDTTSAVSAGAGSTTNVYFVSRPIFCFVTFTKVTINVSVAGTAGDKMLLGIYDANYNLIVQATFTSTGSTGVYAATVPQTTLRPGLYIFAMGAVGGVVMKAYGNTATTQLGSIMNQNSIKMGFINNPPVGGLLPNPLNSSGAFTGNNGIVVPFQLLEA
jgi:hypothetical protein